MNEVSAEKRESMTRKIAGLLALAEKAGTEEEAEAATKMAEKLMVRFGIEEAMARAAGGAEVKPEEIIEKRFDVTVKSYDQAQIQLMFQVALGMGLSGYKSGRNTAFYVAGHKSDVERYEMLINSLLLQAMTGMKSWWKSAQGDYRFQYASARDKNTARCEFLSSFGAAVKQRLEATKKEEVEIVPGSALVMRDKEQEVKDYIDSKTLRAGRGGNFSGNAAGYNAGKNASLGEKGLGGGRAALG